MAMTKGQVIKEFQTLVARVSESDLAAWWETSKPFLENMANDSPPPSSPSPSPSPSPTPTPSLSSAPASPSSSSSSPGPSSPRGTASKAILNHLELNREALAKKGDDRTQKAADWTEKELKRLIGFIKEVGKPDPATKKITTTYGELFAHTENQLEALSGTLKTAKKRKLVSYEAEMLFQGRSNHVVIVLESEDVEGSAELAASPRRSPSPRASPKGFSQESGSNKCVHCGKTVYPLEKVAAGKHNYHKNCFKCHDCEKKLDAKKFCTVQDRVFCKDCYMAEVNLPFPERRKKWDPTKEKRAGQA